MRHVEEPQEATPAESFRYDHVIDLNADGTHAKVVRLVGTDKRVLELGCATGYMSRVFRERGCQVVAVEVDPDAAARAAASCERVIVGDIEQIDLARELGEDRFDVVVAADVLEHLKDPSSLLIAIRRYLRPDGYVVASIPNVAHGSVRLALLGGGFPYSELGLLDRTHLRFYTRESMEQLFDDAGFAVVHVERQDLGIDASEVPYDRAAAPAALLEALSRDPEALTYQFVVVAYPMPRAALRFIRSRLQALAEARDAAHRELAQLEQTIAEQTEHLDALAARIEVMLRREAELRTTLLDTHERSLRRDQRIQALRTREAELEAQLAESDEIVARLRDELAAKNEVAAAGRQAIAWRQELERSKLWQMIVLYWRGRARVREWLRGRRR